MCVCVELGTRMAQSRAVRVGGGRGMGLGFPSNLFLQLFSFLFVTSGGEWPLLPYSLEIFPNSI